MAVSVSSVLSRPPHEIVGNRKKTVTDVTGDSAYPSGGEPLTAANLGLRKVVYAVANPVATGTNAGTAAIAAKYDVANSKLLVYDGDSEVGAVNLSDLVVRVEAYGW